MDISEIFVIVTEDALLFDKPYLPAAATHTVLQTTVEPVYTTDSQMSESGLCRQVMF